MHPNLRLNIIIPTRLSFGIILLFNLYLSKAEGQHVNIIQQGTPTSIRGLSVVNNNTAWVSGSEGSVAITTNGGKTWLWQKVKGYEQSDFRDIEAFSDKEAIIMSSGTPALILKTSDGGVTWAKKYRNTDTLYFLDAMDFVDNNHGFVLGDPINNKFVLLETKDGGETWSPFSDQPDAMQGEACFAASGTCLKISTSTIKIVTGGSHSRLLVYTPNTSKNGWISTSTGLLQGKSSQGAFSFAENISTQVFVGGDYTNYKRTDSTATYIAYSCYANTINYPITPPAGYQSCVAYIKDNTFLSTGTSGTNITNDSGQTWSKIDGISFNVCHKAKTGTLFLLAGDNGKIAILNL